MLTLTTDHWMIKSYIFIQKNLWRNDQDYINYKLGLGAKHSQANFCEIARDVFLWPTVLASLVLTILFALFVLPFILGGLANFLAVWSFILTMAFVFGGGFFVVRYIVFPIVSKAKTKIGEIDTFQVYKKALKDKTCPLMQIKKPKKK